MNPDAILQASDHRPWPLPKSPWLILQSWRQVLFAHWAMPLDAVRACVPSPLDIETWEGTAWVSVVAFRIDPFRSRALPLSLRFPELNLRTYVKFGGVPGVYFFSLDAASAVAVRGARTLFRLNYFKAEMEMYERDGVQFRSHRLERPRVDFSARYRAKGAPATAAPDSLDGWLTERYCLFAVRESKRVFRTQIHHLPWLLQEAEAELGPTTLFTAAGLPSPAGMPRLHFALRQDTLTWGPELVG